MAKSALGCQLCGRKPAKYCSFTGHQGFVIFRRQSTVSGTFCRDCAIEAYMHARGVSLKGMWFSPASLLLGAVSTAWDSLKLLDLPPEVTDAPWVWHKVGCPRCGGVIRSLAGKCTCPKCNADVAILSCIHCKGVNATLTSDGEDAVGIERCRRCFKATQAPICARNAPGLVIARMLAEIAGQVHCKSDPVPIAEWLAALLSVESTTDETVRWLWERFEHRINDRRLAVLRETLSLQRSDVIQHAFEMAFQLCTPEQRETLKPLATQFACSLGRDSADVRSKDFADACDTLGIKHTATRKEAEKAYRKLAMQAHPDRVASQRPEGEADAVTRMKILNAAFSLVTQHLESGQTTNTDRFETWRNPDAAAEVRRRRDAAAAIYDKAKRNEGSNDTKLDTGDAKNAEEVQHVERALDEALEAIASGLNKSWIYFTNKDFPEGGGTAFRNYLFEFACRCNTAANASLRRSSKVDHRHPPNEIYSWDSKSWARAIGHLHLYCLCTELYSDVALGRNPDIRRAVDWVFNAYAFDNKIAQSWLESFVLNKPEESYSEHANVRLLRLLRDEFGDLASKNSDYWLGLAEKCVIRYVGFNDGEFQDRSHRVFSNLPVTHGVDCKSIRNDAEDLSESNTSANLFETAANSSDTVTGESCDPASTQSSTAREPNSERAAVLGLSTAIVAWIMSVISIILVAIFAIPGSNNNTEAEEQQTNELVTNRQVIDAGNNLPGPPSNASLSSSGRPATASQQPMADPSKPVLPNDELGKIRAKAGQAAQSKHSTQALDAENPNAGSNYATGMPRDQSQLAQPGAYSNTVAQLPDSSELFTMRTWTSADGKFTVLARFEKLDGGQVVLFKSNGRFARVPVSRLSIDDIGFLRRFPFSVNPVWLPEDSTPTIQSADPELPITFWLDFNRRHAASLPEYYIGTLVTADSHVAEIRLTDGTTKRVYRSNIDSFTNGVIDRIMEGRRK